MGAGNGKTARFQKVSNLHIFFLHILNPSRILPFPRKLTARFVAGVSEGIKKNILIVDDETEVLRTISQLVEHEGYCVIEASGAAEAMDILSREYVDLVMTDLMMPGITGWQLLDECKPRFTDTKVVVFTGYIDSQGESLLVDRKADGFLTKPVHLAKLRELLAALLHEEEVLGGRIIAVDDEPITLMMFEVTLAEAGHDVRLCASALEAFEAEKADPPDLFLIDLMMPDIDGFELCKQLRDLDSTRHIPIIIVTGHTDRATVLRALDLGIQGFIAKPHQPEALLDKVRKTLAQTRREEN